MAKVFGEWLKARRARRERVERRKEAMVAAEPGPWRCRACGAPFISAAGKIVGGTCPNGRPTCPLERAE